MKGYNLPDNVSPNNPDAPWNKEEQECTCPEEQPAEETGLEVIAIECPIHGLPHYQKED